MNTSDLIEKAKVKTGISSDYGIAKHLGVSAQNLSQWRKGRQLPNVPAFAKLSHAAGMTMEEALPYLGEPVIKKTSNLYIM